MESTCLSYFTVKVNVGVYKLYTAPNFRRLYYYFQRIILLAPGSKYFGMRA